MNISYKWLRSLIDTKLTPQEVADILTSIGLETGTVEEVESISGGLKGLVVGHVLTCVEHPNSDHLKITTVDLGEQEPQQIVCGAPNVAAGQLVIVATVGTKLGLDTDKPFTIKRSKIRGVESNGMICSEIEIGVGQASGGIIVLPEGAAKPGTAAADYYQVASDYVLEVDITPNRVDATSHFGVARDLAAYISLHESRDIRAKLPEVPALKWASNSPYQVKVVASDLCDRFELIHIEGVTVAESPDWLKKALTTIGLRPINNIVDITNYVLHEYGQPLHSYDADKIEGGALVVRTANAGESIQSLDQIERKLTTSDLIIADQAGHPLCIAGVMGGTAAEVKEGTSSILLESANFNATSVRRSAKRFALNTDSSFRYERGLDAENTHWAIQRAAALILEIAGGQIVNIPTDIYPHPQESYMIDLNIKDLTALAGAEIPITAIHRILRSLDIELREETEGILHLAVPRYRTDVTRQVDVIEDILRIYGYNNIPMPGHTLMALSEESDEDLRYRLQIVLSEQLVGAGFNEILNNSLTRVAYYKDLKTWSPDKLVPVLNPLSHELDVMRQTLLFGGLESIEHNEKRRSKRTYYFEWGNTYEFDRSFEQTLEQPLAPYHEVARLGIWIAGDRVSDSWAHPSEAAQPAELKATIYNVLKRCGVRTDLVEERVSANDAFETGIDLYATTGHYLGTWGIVSHRLAKELDLSHEVYFAELDFYAIWRAGKSGKFEAKDLPKFPEVKRDLSLLLDEHISYAQVEKTMRKAERRLLKHVELFDVYEGKNLPAGKKSYAVSFYLLDNKTMSDKQIDAIMQKIIRALKEELAAELR